MRDNFPRQKYSNWIRAFTIPLCSFISSHKQLLFVFRIDERWDRSAWKEQKFVCNLSKKLFSSFNDTKNFSAMGFDATMSACFRRDLTDSNGFSVADKTRRIYSKTFAETSWLFAWLRLFVFNDLFIHGRTFSARQPFTENWDKNWNKLMALVFFEGHYGGLVLHNLFGLIWMINWC